MHDYTCAAALRRQILKAGFETDEKGHMKKGVATDAVQEEEVLGTSEGGSDNLGGHGNIVGDSED